MKKLFTKAALYSSIFFLGGCLLLSTSASAQQGNNEAPQNAEDISPLLIGEKIPEATLLDATGKSFNLNESVAQKPTILIFYRGGWCPSVTGN